MALLRRFRTPLVILIGFVIVYALIGFVAMPYVIKEHVFPKVSEHLKRPALVKEVEINPFTLSVRLAGIEIQEADHAPLMGFEELFVNFQLSSAWHQAYVFDEIRLVMPFVSVRIMPNGLMNLVEMVKSASGAAVSQEKAKSQPVSAEKKLLPAVEIAVFKIEQGVVEFRDESKAKPFEVEIVPIQILLKHFSTRPGSKNVYAFTAEVRKEEYLNWEGNISLEPIQSEGKFSLTGVRGPVLWLYVKDRFRFDIPDGSLNISARYRFDTNVEPFNLFLSDGELSLTNLKLTESGHDDPLVAVPSLLAHGINLDLAKQTLVINSVESKDAALKGWLNPDGTVNYQSLLVPPPSDAGKESVKEPAPVSQPASLKEQKPWSVNLKELGLKNYGVVFEDRTRKTPVHIEIGGLDFNVKAVRVPFKDPIPFQLTLKLNQTGKLDVRGDVTVEPLTAAVELTSSQIGIKPFQPYFDRFVELDVAKGAIDLDGKVQYAQIHPKGPLLRYQGNVAIKNLSMVERSAAREFLSWRMLALNRLAVNVEPTSIKIGEIGLQEPSAHVVVQQDGSLNLSHLIVASDQGGAPPTESAPDSKKPAKKESPPVSISIETVTLVKAAATFADQSIQPNVETGIHDLTGTIKGLSSKQLAKADVALAGKVDNVAPLKIAGKINPLSEDAYTDLVLTFDSMDLTTVAPYAGKYVGRPITKGKLFLDLKYNVSQKQLTAENKVLVDQFTLGESTNSPDATSLPVGLALALLKDRKGQIDIDLPVRGDLNDPNFKYGRAVLNVLGNLITKIATSPFAALGSLVGGSGEDLAYVEFLPGTEELSGKETAKLVSLAKALDARPGLRLEVAGAADPKLDGLALAQQQFQIQLRKAKQLEQRGSGQSDGKGEAEFVLSKEDEIRLITELYGKKFSPEGGKTGQANSGASAKPGPSVSEMKQRLIESISVEESVLRVLAQNRGKQIRTQLIQEGKIPEGRVFLLEVDLKTTGGEKVKSHLTLLPS